MRISDWSSDVCSYDLAALHQPALHVHRLLVALERRHGAGHARQDQVAAGPAQAALGQRPGALQGPLRPRLTDLSRGQPDPRRETAERTLGSAECREGKWKNVKN